MTELLPLERILHIHAVRPLNERHVERLIQKIETLGLLRQYPLAVTEDGVLYRGNHKYEALKRLGRTEAYMDVGPPPNGSLTKAAIDLNIASEDALPMTFCCYAELIWQMLKDKAQQAVADELGWSRGAVSNYAALQEIDEKAWTIIATTVRDFRVPPDSEVVALSATAVAFTERLLRVLPPLAAEQQYELCRLLAKGKDRKGHKFEKADFTLQAQRYRALNMLWAIGREMICAAIPEGEQRDGYLAEFAKEVQRPLYVDECFREVKGRKKDEDSRWEPNADWRALVEKGTLLAPSKPRDVIQAYISAYEDLMKCRVLIGDFREVGSQLGDESVYAIVTDPPYDRESIGLFESLAALAARVLKPSGSCIVLCGQSYLPDYIDALRRHLDYHWTIGVHLPGGQAVQQYQRGINAFWKPALWFTKGPIKSGGVSDFIRTDVNNNDKRFHKWGQSEQIMAGLVERCSLPGQVVLDPMMGAGTTGVVCRATNREFIGIEIDEKIAREAQERIAGMVPAA
jgi:DNA methylase